MDLSLNSHKINRRRFLVSIGTSAIGAATVYASNNSYNTDNKKKQITVPADWMNPPAEFSLCPFWFWNDELSEQEIVRQIKDFRAHGVYGFLIHPRAGLPKSIGWMSKNMIKYMRVAIEEAAKHDMQVVLYDEGMYPSGSSSGQVVQENPKFRTRGLFAIDLDEAKPGTEKYNIHIGADSEPELAPGQNLVAVIKRKQNGHRIAVVDRAISDKYSVIRGLHFLEDDPPRQANHREVPENSPPGANILNPEAVACFIRLVYQRYYDEFKEHFGKTIPAIFTDEPSILARRSEQGVVAGTTGILEHVNRFLGYDFRPYLPTLWYKDEPDSERYRRDYNRALQARLEETFYEQISQWCDSHGIALCGHPAAPDDIGHLRYFQIPGQDIVWRYIEPNKASALEGPQSTQAKCASSAMIHLRRRRNLNEYCGAYGHNFTFEEMKWLTNWLIVRGCNMLVPHAFYYSIRGPRIDERPPDVGPNSPWWEQYKGFTDAARRLCWLNSDCKHVCCLAILGLNDYLPWQAAKVCFQNQRDFNYLEARHLWEDAQVRPDGIHIAGMHYKALIVEFEPPTKAKKSLEVLEKAGRLIRWEKAKGQESLLNKIGNLIPKDMNFEPSSPDIRIRHVVKDRFHYYIVFNEGQEHLKFSLAASVQGQRYLLEPQTGQQNIIEDDMLLQMRPHELKVIRIVTKST
ncbi:MAG: hypothetical protein JW837_00370 [Sedimentisphaerales bacterium]|nr:hypothetical protein [Sedimentisphaerales bacterium]